MILSLDFSRRNIADRLIANSKEGLSAIRVDERKRVSTQLAESPMLSVELMD